MQGTLEIGVRRSLVAHLRARGDSESAANTKADANLQAATDYVKSQINMFRPTKYEAKLKLDTLAFLRAFQNLKTWAQSNIV